MKYNDKKVTHEASTMTRHLETHRDVGRNRVDVFAIRVGDASKMGMPAWLDVPAATELRNELNAFIGDEAPPDPTQITLTVPAGDFEVQSIAAMIDLLNRHDTVGQMRVLGYLQDRLLNRALATNTEGPS